jgi:hypothetical protein
MSNNLKQIKVNFTLEHHEKLTYLAKELGLTKAQWIRSQLRTTFENPREPSITRVHKVADPELLYHLNKIGNNLNQIAKHTNEGKPLDMQILIQLVSIEKDLKQLL